MSKDNLLIYGMKNETPDPVDLELSEFCNPVETGTGISLALYSSEGRRKMHDIWFHDPVGKGRMTGAQFDSALHVMRDDFLKSVMILKSGQEMTFVKEVPLMDYDIDQGLQYLQIVYYCGQLTPADHEVNETAIREHARLFQGCAMSGRISLVRK